MTVTHKIGRIAGLSLLAALAPRPAEAFLLVAKSAKTSGDRVEVAAVREGRDTVLSIQASARGASSEVALLVPVPATVGEPRTLKPATLAPVERVSGPRVVEYWEMDPCEFHDLPSTSDGTFDAAPAPTPASAEAGDLATEVSPAKTGAELVASLKHDGYAVPEKAEAILDGYLKAGMKIVVARADTAKLPRDGDTAVLPTLRLHTQSDDLTLPTRLLAAGGGRRELSIYVLAPGARFEASSQPNLAVPTNLDVADEVRASLPLFYRALVDRTFEKSPGALLTEYAWRASSCELCSAPLGAADIDALGDTSLPSALDGKRHEVLVEAASVSSRPDGPDEVRTLLGACYGKALAAKKDLAGEVSLTVEVGSDGAIGAPAVTRTSDEALAKCTTDAVKASKQWKPGARGTLTVKFSPLSRAYFSGLVLTALRARYDAVPDHDLTLIPARAIEGGREMSPEGTAEKRVYPAPAGNDFHARYVVRHAFSGPIKCESPARGAWGGPPKDAVRTPPDAGTVPGPDAGPKLASWLQGDLPDLASYAIHFGPPAPAPATSATAPAPAPSAPAPPPPAPAPKSGCGSCAVGSDLEVPAWAPLAALALLVLRRPRRRG